MSPWWTLLWKVLWVSLGALLGQALGGQGGQPGLGLVLGVALTLGPLAGLQAWRASRVLSWLRADAQAATPGLRGPWGDAAYHADKALRRRDRALQQLQAEHQQTVQAIQASPNGVLSLDRDGRIEWCNAVACLHLGLNAERDRWQLITNLVRHPDLVQYLQGGDFSSPTTLASPQDGAIVVVHGRRYGGDRLLLVTVDVSDRERADVMRREFVAHVSHEVRTPLTVLSGFVDTLLNLPLPPDEQRRLLGLMRGQTERMLSLVQDLLVLARLEGSPRPAADQWWPVGDLLDRVQESAEALSKGRHPLQWPEVGTMEWAGQESELHSAVANLVHNAIRYTPEGGRITVSIDSDANGDCLLHVQDAGIGIAREHLPRLAQRFYRVDPSRSRESGGTGLGLAIVKHAIARHGGELLIHSEPGKGSRFSLRLPAARVRRA